MFQIKSMFRIKLMFRIKSMFQFKNKFKTFFNICFILVNLFCLVYHKFSKKILNVKTNANCHIKFLNFLKKMIKTFKINCTIKTNEKSITLKKIIIQTNQKSKMNIISKLLKNQLKIFKKQFSNIKFHEFIMRTIDFKNTFLTH